jgi:hypothetical protein
VRRLDGGVGERDRAVERGRASSLRPELASSAPRTPK